MNRAPEINLFVEILKGLYFDKDCIELSLFYIFFSFCEEDRYITGRNGTKSLTIETPTVFLTLQPDWAELKHVNYVTTKTKIYKFIYEAYSTPESMASDIVERVEKIYEVKTKF